ncbi:TRAP transporter small permease [Cohaesibacter celericrescens]|uniref:TRAP transporter small permease protein n=1 Tax=Cohaesibacter celericrescens TaxID=2067669 RepID=A0A2N5XVY5_9HYPH|nr:TRAP transporter small permease [Cohaesibacter celericrescens]PLW78650.1 TRAP transporter small permease [Cohaesibacter celericrescens]
MEAIFKFLRKFLFGISVAAMLVMLTIIFAQVVTRYIFGFSFEWTEELARFLFVWVVFLGSALIMGEDGHLAVELLPRLLKDKTPGILLSLFINACGYVFIFLLIIQGWKMTTTMTFQTSPGLGISMSYVYAIMPVSGILMLMYHVKDTISIFRHFTHGRSDPKTVDQQPIISAD